MKFIDTPKLIGLGGMRCGSTSIHRYLTQHPAFIAPDCPDRKEVHRFDAYSFSQRQYESTVWPEATPGQVLLENTPEYFTCPHSPELIAAAPSMWNAKFFVLLRNPVDRAFSHWKKRIETREEELDFGPALQAEAGRVDHNLQWMTDSPEKHLYNHLPFTYGYKYQSDYPRHLARWFMKIARNRIMVIKSEDFFRNPELVLDRLCEFAGVLPQPHWDTYTVHNETAPKYTVDAAVWEQLHTYFKPQVQALQYILGSGYDITWPSIVGA